MEDGSDDGPNYMIGFIGIPHDLFTAWLIGKFFVEVVIVHGGLEASSGDILLLWGLHRPVTLRPSAFDEALLNVSRLNVYSICYAKVIWIKM